MRIKGKINSWNDDKGFGFITPLKGGVQHFIHITAFNNRKRKPKINEIVTYALSKDKKGRSCAKKATLAGDKLPQKKLKKGQFSIILALLFFVIVIVSVFMTQMPFLVLPFYGVMSLVTFLVYAKDKSAAQKGKWRTSEATLHLLSLAGGWLGAVFAQQTLRHKSQKQRFRFVFWVTVFLNCAMFFWLHTATGMMALQMLISKIG